MAGRVYISPSCFYLNSPMIIDIISIAFLNLIIDFSHFLCYNQSIALNKGGPYELKGIYKCIS